MDTMFPDTFGVVAQHLDLADLLAVARTSRAHLQLVQADGCRVVWTHPAWSVLSFPQKRIIEGMFQKGRAPATPARGAIFEVTLYPVFDGPERWCPWTDVLPFLASMSEEAVQIKALKVPKATQWPARDERPSAELQTSIQKTAQLFLRFLPSPRRGAVKRLLHALNRLLLRMSSNPGDLERYLADFVLDWACAGCNLAALAGLADAMRRDHFGFSDKDAQRSDKIKSVLKHWLLKTPAPERDYDLLRAVVYGLGVDSRKLLQTLFANWMKRMLRGDVAGAQLVAAAADGPTIARLYGSITLASTNSFASNDSFASSIEINLRLFSRAEQEPWATVVELLRTVQTKVRYAMSPY